MSDLIPIRLAEQACANLQAEIDLLKTQVERLQKQVKYFRLFDRDEVAKHLGVRVETVSRWTTSGTIPCVRIGKRSVRYLLPQIVSQLRRRKVKGPQVKLAEHNAEDKGIPAE